MSQWRDHVRTHLPGLGVRPERELEIVDELALQLEATYDNAIAHGLAEADARAQALAEIPDWRTLADTIARIERRPAIVRPIGAPPSGGVMTGFVEDLRSAARALTRAPGFTLAATGTLALGIAATAIIYSLVDGILLRPLPIDDPDRIMVARETAPDGDGMSLSWPNFLDWQARATSFERLAVWRGTPASLTGIETPRRIFVRQVSWNLFPVLGVRPILGRDLTEADDQIGVERVCLVSYSFWQRDLGGDPNAVGRRLSLDETPVTVVGVLPPGFTIAREEDLFLPFGNFYAPGHFMLARGNHNGLAAIGRLRPDVTLDQARAELALIAQQLAKEHPNTNSGQGATVRPLMDVVVGPMRAPLMVLLVAVGTVLLIACVNIANLLLVRGAGRAQELEIRLALGAGRWRIVRQLMVESLLLGAGGGILGLALAMAGFDTALALIPDDQPRLHVVALNARVMIVAGVVSIATGLSFGLIPAWHAGGHSAASLLRGARVSDNAAGRATTRRVLLVAELALTVVLLAGAALMVRTMSNLFAVDLGFDPQRVLSARVIFQPHDMRPTCGASS